jgi:transposase
MDTSKTVCENSRLYCLSDEAWQRLEPLFPHPHGKRGFQPQFSNRTAFEAVLYRARTGCPWRDLPEEYGYWHAIYMRW